MPEGFFTEDDRKAFREMYESDTFKRWWQWYELEVQRVTAILVTSGVSDWDPGRVALQSKYNQGVLDGVLRLQRMKDDLVEVEDGKAEDADHGQ